MAARALTGGDAARRRARWWLKGLVAAAAVLMVPAGAEAEPEQDGDVSQASYDDEALSALRQQFDGYGNGSEQDDSTDDTLPGLSDDPRALADLPSGGGAVSAQATALPEGPSSINGMGESFTTQLSTGILSYTVPLKLPTARGGAQPNIGLSYTSAAGYGIAGKGWSLGASAISRQTDRGIPRYDDRSDWYPGQDRFVFGGMELVPICTVSGGACSASLATEVMPAWAEGWQYFRARIEGGFLRFFWSPDHLTWRVQSKEGANFELGVPLDGSGYRGALLENPDDSAEIYRWYIIRQYDSEGGVNSTASPQPVNAVVYRYTNDGGAVYLSDVYDTSPQTNPTTTDLSQYAHHTRVAYEARPDVVRSYRQGWLVEHRLRVSHVDITSKPFSGSAGAARELVRRYHFSYDQGAHVSLLTSVQMEGRCQAPATVTELGDQTLGSTSCPRLPPLTFRYQRVSGARALSDSNGYAFEPFDEQIRQLDASPPHSLDEALTGLMDVNADGLPDVLVTAPGLYDGKHGVFFNTLSSDNQPGFESLIKMGVQNIDGVDEDVLKLNNSNVAPLDLDADGIANLVHMPADKEYAVFSPEETATGWQWLGRKVLAASDQDVKIDFTRNADNIRVMDVNADGLVDIVHSSPTEMQTFFALGRYPGGHDQFGKAQPTGAATAEISNDPVTTCAPWSGATLRFSDPDVQIADMNGDGLADIARVRSGQILYWPGRGNGYWGTGSRKDCAAGELGQDRHVEMLNAPRFGVTSQGTLLVSDVNADGLADIVEVHQQGVDIYINDNGVGWTERHIIDDTPVRPAASNYVRLTDIDGSGTPDILWGRAYEYQYIDLAGGKIPHLLIETRNGIGATTELEYETTVDVMRDAKLDGDPWETRTPTVSPVLVRSTVRDNLDAINRPGGVHMTEYTYRDPVYEGRQREFRGFREALVKTIGDNTGPTSIKRNIFLLGECKEGFEGSPADVCSPSLRWQDNWREPLKGLPVVVETFDETGVYHSSQHTTYELRQLYAGLDGRRVSIAYPVAKDVLSYDVASFDGSSSQVMMDEVLANLAGIGHTEQGPVYQRANAGTAHIRSESVYDDFGNVLESTKKGCISGCPAGVDEAITAHSEYARPSGDDSGWMFRETRSYVTGSVHTEHRGEVTHSYNAQGKLTETRGVLSGTLSLDRFHEDPQKVTPGVDFADAPPGQSGGESASTEILLVSHTNPDGSSSYDQFGHALFKRGPNGRCSSSAVDPLYAQLTVSATVYIGDVDPSGCGAQGLTSTVTYDRGLEAPVDSEDATGQPAHVEYDEFGRVVSMTSAMPDGSGLAPYPSLTVEYRLPSDPSVTPYSTTIARALDGQSFSSNSYHETWSFSDGLGRTIATLSEADASAGDAGDWVVGGAVEYNSKGAAIEEFDPWFYTGAPEAFDLSAPPAMGPSCRPVGSVYREYDAFNRPIHVYGRDGELDSLAAYHALSQDAYDAADAGAGPHANTPVTIVSDGHGRSVRKTERIVVGGSLEERHVLNEYLPTGEVYRITQQKAGSPDVVRWLRYDSLGRMVLNVEPNTSPDFNADPATPASQIKAWRYAYNDAGDMVGVSDARGCGANYYYDAAGRLVAEDRSPCLTAHADYSVPDLATGDGTEAFYRYDQLDPDTASAIADDGTALSVDATYLSGRVASVSGLGSKVIFSYDALGRGIQSAKRIVKPGEPSATLSQRYAPRWYVREQTFDAADRPLTATTGVTTTELLGSGGQSQIAYHYDQGGLLRRIDGSYGTLLANAQYFADGSSQALTLGDGASTQRDFCYDANHRLDWVQTYRAAADAWSNPPTGYSAPGTDTTQLQLEYYQFHYDTADNIVEIDDLRTPSEWPGSAKPVTRQFEYDDLYRLSKVTYTYPGGTPDPWTSPYDAENTDSERTPQPSPHVAFDNRVQQQTYDYDWLGTPKNTTDDANGFWDRSLGDTTVGTATAGPHQLQSASNRSTGATRKGDLDIAYDAAGNMTDLVVRRDGPCLPTGASCWQRFFYEWNEVGELVRARRWDLSGGDRTTYGDPSLPLPSSAPAAELRYTYDAGGNRVLKTAVDANAVERHTAYVSSALEIRSTSWDSGATTPDYVLDADKVQLRLPAGMAKARVLYSNESLPTLTSGQQHVFLEFSDHLGSSTAIIEHATGELVEFATYQAYGATESDFRPGRWDGFREPLHFSGKEEDIEVGLMYFGARYFSPFLNIWLSPDPVTIHDLGSDINPYAYVHGRPLMGVDPDGRFGFLIGALIGLAIGAVTNIVAQAATVGFQNINWGITGVLGAALSGAVGGGVSAAVGGAVTSGVVSSGMGQVAAQAVGGFAAGYAGAAASQVTSLALTGNSSGFAQGILIGGIGGLAGGAVGGAVGTGLGNVGGNVVVGLAGAAGGYVASLAFGGEMSLESLGLSLGSGLAGGLASGVAQRAGSDGRGSLGVAKPGASGEAPPTERVINPYRKQQFDSLDQAAYAALDRVYDPSLKHNVEIGGGIYRLENGKYVVGDFYIGNDSRIQDLRTQLRWELQRGTLPENAVLKGAFHVHPPGGPDASAFSPGDLDFTRATGIEKFHMADPGGRVRWIDGNGNQGNLGSADVPTLLPGVASGSRRPDWAVMHAVDLRLWRAGRY